MFAAMNVADNSELQFGIATTVNFEDHFKNDRDAKEDSHYLNMIEDPHSGTNLVQLSGNLYSPMKIHTGLYTP